MSDVQWVPGLFWQSLLVVAVSAAVLGFLLRKTSSRLVLGWYALLAAGIIPLLAINWWTNSGEGVTGPPEAYPMAQEFPHYLTFGVMVTVLVLILGAATIKTRRPAQLPSSPATSGT